MPTTTTVTVHPARRVRGRMRVPGDKSISHRYALLAAIADGTTRIRNYAPGADCRSTLACLGQLGVTITATAGGPDEGSTVEVHGAGLGRLAAPAGPLDAGNSGSTMRMLAGVLAGHPFTATITGDASLQRRPMRRIVTPLERMGARVETRDGRPPVTISGGRLTGIDYVPEVPSAQVKSAVLLAGLHAGGTTTVREPARTRDHTELALEAFGVPVVRDGLAVCVRGGSQPRAARLRVPGDISSAAFWAVAAAALPGSEIEVVDVGLNPTRLALVDTLRDYGARVELVVEDTGAGEPAGRLIVRHGTAGHLEVTPDQVPGLIDELPVLAALATHGGSIAVSGASELRGKESDRITALVSGLTALGADAVERPDGFEVRGGSRLSGGTVDACGDHRLAMAFAIAALGAASPVAIEGAEAVAVSYPAFFDDLATISE